VSHERTSLRCVRDYERMSMEIVGKEKALERVKKAIEILERMR
jgi:hypothetical protein